MTETTADSIFEEALVAASEAFTATLDRHFGRTYDGSEDDYRRLLNEYRASASNLRGGAAHHLRSGLIDADFVCWHSGLADLNFGEDA